MTTQELTKLALRIRRHIIEIITKAGSGHPAGSFSAVEILVTLYFHTLHHDPQNPKWEHRDRFLISCGHAAPALYAVMAEAGYFPVEKLATFRQFSSPLQGHPHNGSLPGVEISSGSLGQGLSQAIGMALAARMNNASHRIYCLMSDGEQDEGQVWEAAMLSGKEKLDNLTAIIDRNGIQIDGLTEDIMPLEPLKNKYESFGWHVVESDGHNYPELINAFDAAAKTKGQPTVIIAHTIPGKGVDFMENNFVWHGKAPSAEQAKEALNLLEDR